MSTHALRTRPSWLALERHYQKMEGLHLRQLFAEDAARGERGADHRQRSAVGIADASGASTIVTFAPQPTMLYKLMMSLERIRMHP